MSFGDHEISVLVGGKGYAQHPANPVTFRQLVKADNFTPEWCYTTGKYVFQIRISKEHFRSFRLLD